LLNHRQHEPARSTALRQARFRIHRRLRFLAAVYVIAIGSNGAVSVSLHTHSDVRQICGHNPSRMESPITLAVVAGDGRGTSGADRDRGGARGDAIGTL
jgi:hypothetical protein